MSRIRIREVPQLWVTTEQRTVDQAQLQEWLPGAMGRVAQAAGDFGGVSETTSLPYLERGAHPAAEVFIVIYEGNPNEGPVPVEVCAPIGWGTGAPGTRVVPAHREAFVRLSKADTVPPARIGAAYDEVEQWAIAQGRQIAGAPRETYYTDYYAAAPGDAVFDVAWPIE